MPQAAKFAASVKIALRSGSDADDASGFMRVFHAPHGAGIRSDGLWTDGKPNVGSVALSSCWLDGRTPEFRGIDRREAPVGEFREFCDSFARLGEGQRANVGSLNGRFARFVRINGKFEIRGNLDVGAGRGVRKKHRTRALHRRARAAADQQNAKEDEERRGKASIAHEQPGEPPGAPYLSLMMCFFQRNQCTGETNPGCGFNQACCDSILALFGLRPDWEAAFLNFRGKK
jgi:hypothetical protein